MIPRVDIFSFVCLFMCSENNIVFMPLQSLYKSILETLKNKDI